MTTEIAAAEASVEYQSSRFTKWLDSVRRYSEHFVASPPDSIITLTPDAGGPLNQQAMTSISKCVQDHGFAHYAWSSIPASTAERLPFFLSELGLVHADTGVIRDLAELSLLQDLSGTPRGRFPPYQSGPMNWHTDGYYNAPESTLRSFTLHCMEPAAKGGSLHLMDDKLLILALYDDNPDLLALLSHSRAMTIPANQDNEGHDRPDRTVPMIFRHNDGKPGLRFTTRSRHIHWRNSDTQDAATRAAELIEQHKDWQVSITLKRGQGLITRNILHARDQFVDLPEKPKRQILRGRFMQLPQYPTSESVTSL